MKNRLGPYPRDRDQPQWQYIQWRTDGVGRQQNRIMSVTPNDTGFSVSLENGTTVDVARDATLQVGPSALLVTSKGSILLTPAPIRNELR